MQDLPTTIQNKVNELIDKIENAPDFQYDNEQMKLNKILRKYGKTWRWSNIHVEIVELNQLQK